MLVGKLFETGVRNLGRNARRSGITGVVIVAGTMLMFLTGAVGDGVESQLIDVMRLAKYGGHLQVCSLNRQIDYSDPTNVPPLDSSFLIPLPAQFVQILKSQGLETVGYRISGWGLLTRPDTREDLKTTGNLIGIEPDQEPLLKTALPPVKGVFLPPDDDNAVYLGADPAKDLDMRVGDKIVMTVQNLRGGMISRKFTIVGIFDSSGEVNTTAFTTFHAAAELLGANNRPTDLVVTLDHPDQAAEIADRLNKLFRAQDLSVKAEPWEQTLAFYLGLIAGNHALVMIMRVILAIVVVVGIMNTSLMAVQERTREIGTLLTLGYRRWHILFLFVGETVLLGGVSAIVGVVLGLGVGSALSQLIMRVDNPIFSLWAGSNHLKLAVTSANLWMTFGVTVVTTLLASLYPAFVASSKQPVEALRYV